MSTKQGLDAVGGECAVRQTSAGGRKPHYSTTVEHRTAHGARVYVCDRCRCLFMPDPETSQKVGEP